MPSTSMKTVLAVLGLSIIASPITQAQPDDDRELWQLWHSDTEQVSLKTIEHDNMRVELSGGPVSSTFADENSRRAVLDIFIDEERVHRVISKSQTKAPGYFSIEFQDLVADNQSPEIILTEYSGGAHCCTTLTALIRSTDKNWRKVEIATFDGSGKFEDIDGDGYQELLTPDDRFLQAYASYACSYRPWKIISMQTGKAVDITRRPEARSIHQSYLDGLSNSDGEERCSSGYWPAYIAVNAYLGHGHEAWTEMLESYQPKDYAFRDRVICTDPTLSFPKCPDSLKRSITYPESVERDFEEIGLWDAVLFNSGK